jgi:hypothetical protein
MNTSRICFPGLVCLFSSALDKCAIWSIWMSWLWWTENYRLYWVRRVSETTGGSGTCSCFRGAQHHVCTLPVWVPNQPVLLNLRAMEPSFLMVDSRLLLTLWNRMQLFFMYVLLIIFPGKKRLLYFISFPKEFPHLGKFHIWLVQMYWIMLWLIN